MTPRELANEHSKKHNARTTGRDSDAFKKIRELQDRIKMLEEVAEDLVEESDIYDRRRIWNKAKEAKL